MTQIPILSGIRSRENALLDEEYPVNLEPVAIDSGLSKGMLHAFPGTAQFATGPGMDRGGIVWNGAHYRVMGAYLVRVTADGGVATLGYVGDDGRPVSLDYSFDYLSIGSAAGLYYWNTRTGLSQVPYDDLGPVIDHVFVDGYNMTTDGTSLVVTELSDPMAVDPLKYGSSESDPDPVTGLLVLRNEVYALNRHTIDVFQNVGGNGFPFAVITGAVIPRGCVSPSAKCKIGESFAFVGGGRNEALGVYQGGAGQTAKLSTRTIDTMLAEVENPTQIVLEALTYGDQTRLLVHLPDKTLVFLPEVSAAAKTPVWYVRRSEEGRYRPRFFTLAGSEWYCGDMGGPNVGRIDASITTDFGDVRPWEFCTQFLYNEGRGAIVHAVELVGLPGRVPFGKKGVVFFSCTRDGETWGEERVASSGVFGDRRIRVQHRPHWRMSNYLGMRFRGFDSAFAGWARCEAQIEALA